MADGQIFQSKKSGALWIMPDGPNTEPKYLPCHDLEDIEQSFGGLTLIHCIDARGEYVAIGATQDAPEPTTTSLGTYIGKVADFMELVRCPFPIFVHLRSCGKADVFENWDRSAIVQVQKVTNRTRSGLVRKDEDVPAMHTFDVEALPQVIDLFRLTPLNESVNEDGDILDIIFDDDLSCWDSCGGSRGACEYGYAVSSAEAGSPSDTASVLLRTPTSGGWQPTAADPFAAAEDIASIGIFKVGQNTTRILVARGTTDVGNPAEVAYSDDSGATWTNVNVGTVNGQYAVGKKSLFVFNRTNIWLVTTGGYIYHSSDGGESWDAQESANITTDPYNVIRMVTPQVGYAVADGGVVAKTQNGGVTWGSVTSPTANDLVSLALTGRADRLWVGSANNELFYSNDGGLTWNSRSHGGAGGANPIEDIVFSGDYVGALIENVAGVGVLKTTITGGFTWDVQDNLPTNTGLNALYACDSNNIYLAGNDGQIISLGIITN